MRKVLFLFFFLQCIIHYANAQLITYPATQGSILNSDFTVKVRQRGKAWQPIAVYMADVANFDNTKSGIENTSFGYFDFNGGLEVSIRWNKGTIEKSRIRPNTDNILSKITGNNLSFFLNKAHNLSIEINGDIFHNLQLFANAIETLTPLKTDTSVIYYGPGLHDVGTVVVPSNKTVYIAGGAVVRGQLLIDKASNIRVLGHGILTQLGATRGSVNTLTGRLKDERREFRNDELTINFSKNVEVNGPVILPHKYSVFIGQSTDVKIRNIKSFSSEGNADGLDIFCSTNVDIDNIFMRNADDCIAIYGHRWAFFGNTKDIKISNSILWADVAHPIVIGTHGDPSNPDTLSDMKFSNIDILDQHENQIDYQGCIALNAGDANLISKILFENIRIDDIRKGELFNLRVMFNRKYNTGIGDGIANIYFKNLSYKGQNANMSIITGYDETHRVKNITFENLTINGRLIEDNMPGKPGFYKTGDMANIYIGEHVDNVRFTASPK